MIIISSGQTSHHLSVGGLGQEIVVDSGGTVYNTSVGSGGTLYVSGGVVSATSVMLGGSMTVSGGTVSQTSLDFATQYVSGGHVFATVVSAGLQNVFGGVVVSTQLVGTASQDVYGGAVSDTTVEIGAIVEVDGGTVFSTLVSGGREGVYAGTVSGTRVYEGGHEIVKRGTAVSTVLSSGGDQFVSAGSAYGTVLSNGGIQFAESGTISGTQIDSGGYQIVGFTSASIAYGTVVHDGGTELITSAASSYRTLVSSGGLEIVESGGVASGTTVDAGGLLVVLAGGSASGTTGVFVSGDDVVSVSGNAVSGLGDSVNARTVSAATTLYVFSGGQSYAADVVGRQLADGGVVSGARIESGGAQIVSGGRVSTSMVGAGATETVLGGLVSGTSVYDGGVQIVAGGALGGAAFGTLVGNGGSQMVDGGIASSTVIAPGGLEQVAGSSGTAEGMILQTGGKLLVQRGGYAAAAELDGGSAVIAGGTLGVADVGDGGTGIDFSVTGGALVLGFSLPQSDVVSGFAAGDSIDLANLAYSGVTTGTYVGGVLTVAEGGAVEQITVDSAGLADKTFELAQEAEGLGTVVTVTCFCAGTRIATPGGDTSVEDLRAGDLVVLADGRVVPVRWVGVQTVSRQFFDPVRVLPVRIAAGALDGRLPLRELRVSPGHGLLLDGVLVQAGALVGWPGISRDHGTPEMFAYWHIELDEHALLLAEGVPAESYLPSAEDVAFDNRATRPERMEATEMAWPRVKAARQLWAAVGRAFQEHAEHYSG